MSLRRRSPFLFWLSVIAVSGAGACGGHTSTASSPGGSGGSGAASGGGPGGAGATGAGASGGNSCMPDACKAGGTCCATGAPCSPGPDAICECQGGHWSCKAIGTCDPSACGPTSAPCCTPGGGCGYSNADGTYSECRCISGHFSCSVTASLGGAAGSTGADCSGGCGMGLTCCGGTTCANTDDDVHNCGGCGIVCGGTHPYCDHGKCAAPPCANQQTPPDGRFCCGNGFCKNGQLCCSVPYGGTSSPYPGCYAPDLQGTCPVGCPTCK